MQFYIITVVKSNVNRFDKLYLLFFHENFSHFARKYFFCRKINGSWIFLQFYSIFIHFDIFNWQNVLFWTVFMPLLSIQNRSISRATTL